MPIYTTEHCCSDIILYSTLYMLHYDNFCYQRKKSISIQEIQRVIRVSFLSKKFIFNLANPYVIFDWNSEQILFLISNLLINYIKFCNSTCFQSLIEIHIFRYSYSCLMIPKFPLSIFFKIFSIWSYITWMFV